jgi:hypothetical protein
MMRYHAELDTTIQGYSDGVFWERNTLKAQKTSPNRTQISLNRAATALAFARKRGGKGAVIASPNSKRFHIEHA